MRASYYEIDPILEKIAEHVHEMPSMDDTIDTIDWLDEDEDILFVVGAEEDLGISIDYEKFFDGELKVAELMGLMKEAKLSTPEQKAQMRIYRLTHATELKMKAKRHRNAVKKGTKIKMSRQGSASGGYTFTPSPTGPKSSTSSSSLKLPNRSDFSPNKSTQPAFLNLTKMASPLIPQNLQQAAALNPQNPIAGAAGYPLPPPPVPSVVQKPVKRPVNWKAKLPKR